MCLSKDTRFGRRKVYLRFDAFSFPADTQTRHVIGRSFGHAQFFTTHRNDCAAPTNGTHIDKLNTMRNNSNLALIVRVSHV
mmetsp:Transcript_9011/g.23619  ORF Transcript_9011/g.23619 Transcript_9011/m.23619 type:complete len:81 (+) Transcript_9011:731-973(+)